MVLAPDQAKAAVKQAADRLDGVLEFGAVNGVTNRKLMERFSVHSYPSFYLFHPTLGVQVQFPWSGVNRFAEKMRDWAANMVAEWDILFRDTSTSPLILPPCLIPPEHKCTRTHV